MKHLLPHWSDDGLYIDLISRSSGNCPSFSFCFLCFALSFLLSSFSSSPSFLSSTQLCESHCTADFGSSVFSVNICQDVGIHFGIKVSVKMSVYITCQFPCQDTLADKITTRNGHCQNGWSSIGK